MKLVTWNINGVKARHPRMLAWVQRHVPDVLCLQEIKTIDEGFPRGAYEELGYTVLTYGQKAYNGVAILARAPIESVQRGLWDDDPQARLIAGTVQGIRVICAYVPNGESVTSEKYTYKLRWLEHLVARLQTERATFPRVVICGDFNVAPADLDVYDPAAWSGSVLCSPSEREALAAVRAVGLVDVVRQLQPDSEFYTWWDYRAAGFRRNRGMRIDHVYATEDLAPLAMTAEVDREERGGEQPSDHAPVTVTFREAE